jgi:hypothetical protein
MVVIKGEGPFADAVRKAIKYAQRHGVDLSGVEVEVVADPSIKDFGAYTEHLGGLKFRIRYNPRYANDVVLASHETGHVVYWAWAVKTGKTHFFSDPNVIEPLAEAFGAVVARQVFGVPVTFKEAPHNLTQVLPERTTYVTVTVGGKPMAVKVPEWGDSLSIDDYMKRYRAGILLSPYFYNMTNWAHIFGNFTAMPADVIKTVHEAWRSGAVEVVPGWGAVWRREPMWSWSPKADSAFTRQTPNDGVKSEANNAAMNNTQRTNGSTVNADMPQAVNTVKQDSAGRQNSPADVTIQPAGDVPRLSPSTVQWPKYFNEDIGPKYRSLLPEWDEYMHGRRVLLVFRNWEHFSGGRRDSVVSGGTLLIDKNNPERIDRIVWDRRVPVPTFYDPDAWIEIVDEKTGKVLARLKSNELYKVATGDKRFINLFWAHVATEEKWPGWELFVERASELDEKLGTWRQTGTTSPGSPQLDARGAANIGPGGTARAVRVFNAPTEYVPPKVPDYMRTQFDSLLSDLKKIENEVNLRNVGEVHDKFIQLRDKVLDIARAYPQLIDEADRTIGRVGSAIRDASSKLYDALARAAGRDSFWRGEGDVKTPIGVYKYDPATGAFLLSLYDGLVAENIVGYIKDDGTPIVLKKMRSMSEALEEYNKLLNLEEHNKQKQASAQTAVQQTDGSRQTDLPSPLSLLTKMPVIGPVLQVPVSSGDPKASTSSPSPAVQNQTTQSGQLDFFQPLRGAVDFLAGALKAGAGIKLAALGITALGGARPADDVPEHTQLSDGRYSAARRSSRRAVYNRRRGVPKADSSPVSSESGDNDFTRQETEGFVAVKPSGASDETEMDIMRPLDYDPIEAEPSGQSGGSEFVQPLSTQQGQDEFVAAESSRPPNYILAEEENRQSAETQTTPQTSSGYHLADYADKQSDGVPAQLAEAPQEQEPPQKRRRGRPVAVAI